MTSDVNVIISGLPFGEQAVSGLTIHHGINSIPHITIELDAVYIADSTPDFLCNPELYKNRDYLIKVDVEAKTGCYHFEGYFDGLNMSQSVGAVSYSATLKSKFQRLVEVYPRLFGVIPGSFGLFRDSESLHCNHDKPKEPWRENSLGILRQLKMDGATVDYLVEALKLVAFSQTNGSKLVKRNHESGIVLDLMNEAYIKNTELANVQLLNNMDVTALKDCAFKSGQVGPGIMKKLTANQSTLWDIILSCFNDLGACVIVGKDKLFAVPQAQFIKMEHKVPQFQSSDIVINTADPSQYTNFSTSDSGYVNLKACFITLSSAKVGESLNRAPILLSTHMGLYPRKGKDPEVTDGSTGILAVEAPQFCIDALNTSFAYGAETQNKVLARRALALAGDPYHIILDSIKQESKAYTDYLYGLKPMMDNFAKLRFLQAKYGDRGGQLTTFFNPKWVPGSTGSLYTRLPGTFKQFYVTGVNHHISLHIPNNGTASTTVSFSSVRQGSPASNVPGVASEDFYNYSTEKMKSFQTKWVDDITK